MSRNGLRNATAVLLLAFLVGPPRPAAAQEGRAPPRGGEPAEWLEVGIEWAKRAIEAAGVLRVTLGALFATAAYV